MCSADSSARETEGSGHFEAISWLPLLLFFTPSLHPSRPLLLLPSPTSSFQFWPFTFLVPLFQQRENWRPTAVCHKTLGMLTSPYYIQIKTRHLTKEMRKVNPLLLLRWRKTVEFWKAGICDVTKGIGDRCQCWFCPLSLPLYFCRSLNI